MSLSLKTVMGIQNPTRHEKYIIEECIKMLRFHRYSIGYSCPTNLSERSHDKIIDNIIKDLKKVLACPIKEDRAMIIVCRPTKSTRHCRCVEIPMPACKEMSDNIFKKKKKK